MKDLNGKMTTEDNNKNIYKKEDVSTKLSSLLDDSSYNLSYENIKKSGEKNSTKYITSIIKEIENCLQGNKYEKIKKIIFYIIIEFGQNIIKHGIYGNNYIKYHQDNDKIHLTFKNQYIEEQTGQTLRINLEKYNQLDTNTLKSIIKKKLKYNQLSQKGGAGIGLIEVFRKVKGKDGTIKWDFSEENKNNIINFKIDVEIPSLKEKL